MTSPRLESVRCYLCHSDQASPWGEEHGYTMVKCTQCGLVYLNPRPAAEEIDEGSRTGLHKGLNAVGRYSANRMRAYRTKLSPLMPSMRHSANMRWLDIGAGFGELVEALSAFTHPGDVVQGIEPCQPKVIVAQAKGLPVTATPLSQITGQFTNVSLINVYSHLPDPVAFLTGLHRIMEPNGYLLLVTGNGGDIPRREFPGSLYLPDHLSFAGEQNLQSVLAAAQYEVLATSYYAETGSFDSVPVTLVKNIARRLTGRTPVPVALPKASRFRSLWIVARRRAESRDH